MFWSCEGWAAAESSKQHCKEQTQDFWVTSEYRAMSSESWVDEQLDHMLPSKTNTIEVLPEFETKVPCQSSFLQTFFLTTSMTGFLHLVIVWFLSIFGYLQVVYTVEWTLLEIRLEKTCARTLFVVSMTLHLHLVSTLQPHLGCHNSTSHGDQPLTIFFAWSLGCIRSCCYQC